MMYRSSQMQKSNMESHGFDLDSKLSEIKVYDAFISNVDIFLEPFMQMLVNKVVGVKKSLLSKFVSPIKQIISKKTQLISPLINKARHLVSKKKEIVRPLLAPVIGFKRTALGLARNVINTKEKILDSFSRMIG